MHPAHGRKGVGRAVPELAKGEEARAPALDAPNVPSGPDGYGDYDEDAWYRERDERRRSEPFGGYTEDESVRARFSPGDRRHPVRTGTDTAFVPRGYRGVGPRGYRRSDERIREDVCDALTEHDSIDASDIDVVVQAGVVVFGGTVPDRRMKALAEGVAYQCSGVRDVQNELRVVPVVRRAMDVGDAREGPP
ncbi:MAG: BON domain-containing protein [Pseudomonadota bacterium]